jgi:hypothetical protein
VVGNRMKLKRMSLGDFRGIIGLLAGILAIAGSLQCSACHHKIYFLFLVSSVLLSPASWHFRPQ